MENDLLTEKTLRNRLKNLLMIYDSEKDFPKSYVMFGYGNLNIGSKEELLYRIRELCDILNINLEEIKNGDLNYGG